MSPPPTSFGLAAALFNTAASLLVAMCISMNVAAAADGQQEQVADAAAAQAAAAYAQPQSAHLSCLKTLRGIQVVRAGMNEAIAHNDFPAVGNLHAQIKRDFMMTRSQIDDALVRGAWNERRLKREAGEVLGSLEGLDILNFVALAFLTRYDYPTRKIPASVVDATQHMFVQLDGLIVKVEALNAKIPAVRAAAD